MWVLVIDFNNMNLLSLSATSIYSVYSRLIVLLLLILNSNSAYSMNKDDFYISVALEPINKVKIADQTIGDTFGFSLLVGYEFQLSDSVGLGVSLDYYNSTDFESSSNSGSNFTSNSFSGKSIGVSVRPKFYLYENQYYISPFVGLGKSDYSVTSKKVIYDENGNFLGTRTLSADLDDFSYTYGIEVGASFENGLFLSTGWKETYANDGLMFSIKGFYLGAGYHF